MRFQTDPELIGSKQFLIEPMNWRDIHRINTSRQLSPASTRKKRSLYTPARSEKNSHQNSFIKAESHHGDRLIQDGGQIKFTYQASTEWVIKLQKALKQIFNEFRRFCKSIEKQIQKMNSKYRRLTEFYSNNPTLFQLISEASSPRKNDTSRVSQLELGKWSSITLEKEKAFESNWSSKILDRSTTKAKKQKMKFNISRTQSFNHNELRRANTDRRLPRNSEREPSEKNNVLNKVKDQKLNDSFVEMNERLEEMKRMLVEENYEIL